MAIVPTSIPEVQQIVDSADERELWIVGREFERPPYFHVGKGGDMRLARALRVCVENRIMPNGDGSYMVEGSEHRTYRVGDSCSCPNSQKAHTKWCYHMVAVAVYVEWQRRLRPPAPVELGTLRAGTLPLPPVTVDERMAQATPPADPFVLNLPDEGLVAVDATGHAVALGTLPLPPVTVDERLAQAATVAIDHVFDALPVHQEDRMADHEYMPEPDDIAVMDEPEPTPPAPIKIPREFTVSIKGKTHFLYTGLVIAARADGLTSLAADWTYNDAELSLAHAVCTFADGRRYEESGDASPSNVSKGISLHFRRVALTRAKARCLRDALGISECSVEEMEDDSGKRDTPVMTPLTDQEYRQRIWARVKELRPEVKTRADVETFVKGRTKLELHEDNYQAILSAL